MLPEAMLKCLLVMYSEIKTYLSDHEPIEPNIYESADEHAAKAEK